MNCLHVIFLIFLAARAFADFALEMLNRRRTVAHAGNVPEAFAEIVSAETHKKTVAYTLAKTDFGFVELVFDTLLTAALVLCVFAPLFSFAGALVGLENGMSGWAAVWREGVILVGISILISLVDLPFGAYETFGIEAKFGFNKSSAGLWFADQIKGLLVGLAIGLPLAWAILGFYHAFPRVWWIVGQCAFFVFQLVLMVVFPKFILPLFNKLSPLPEGELRDALESLAKRAGFVAKKIEVIDGSKRSGHSNAYFTGFGKWRRIVLFDTLVEQLSVEEISAVLAHEIGHSKRGHITKRLALAFVFGFAFFGFVGWVLTRPEFFAAFGFDYRAGLMFVPALLLLSKMLPLATFWLSPISNYISRRHEYEADAFARELIGSPDALVSALRKLHKENLGNLTPHPLYSTFNYSHPTLLERENALRNTDSSR